MIQEYIIPLLSVLIALTALYFTARKNKREMYNLDADTIQKLYNTIDQQEKRYCQTVKDQEARYQELNNEFRAYKLVMDSQMADLIKEAARLRGWSSRLVKQLEDHRITPEQF